MPSCRTRTVSTKVTEDYYALIAQLAGDLSVVEWAREVLFKAVLSERQPRPIARSWVSCSPYRPRIPYWSSSLRYSES
jgi:hypothetical protein